jgi:hypothetical protein
MTTWTIDNVSLESAGVIALNFSFVNQSADVCTLTLVDRGAALRSWARKTKVTIHRNGELYFIGWVADKGSRESAGDGGLEVTLKGPWFWLEETPFGRLLPADEGGGISCAVQLFLQRGQTIGLREQMIEALSWAQAASGGAFSIGQISPSDAPDRPPPEWVQAARCDDVVRRVAAWAPDSILWCSYGIQPAIHWTAPGARATHVFTKGSAPLMSAQIYEDAAMAPTAVIIQYLRGQDTYRGASMVAEQDAFPQGSDVRTAGAAVFALEVSDNRGESWAQKLFLMAKRYLWSGQITLGNTLMEIRPGDLVRVSGRPDWVGCEALVQTVQVTPDNDGMVCSLGAPRHLGLDDLREMLWWMRSGGTREVVEPTLQLHPWQVYLTTTEETIGPRQVRIAPGVVDFGGTPVRAKWQGRFLDNAEPPFERFENGFSKQYYLRVSFLPDVEKFSGTDTLGNTVETARPVSTGAVLSAEVLDALGTSSAPVVNIRTGRASEGVFWFPLATVSETEGELRVVQHQDKNLTTLFNPPSRLFLL